MLYFYTVLEHFLQRMAVLIRRKIDLSDYSIYDISYMCILEYMYLPFKTIAVFFLYI